LDDEGTLVSDIGAWTDLTRIDLSNNAIQGTIPNEIAQLPLETMCVIKMLSSSPTAAPSPFRSLSVCFSLINHDRLTLFNHRKLINNNLTGTIPQVCGSLSLNQSNHMAFVMMLVDSMIR